MTFIENAEIIFLFGGSATAFCMAVLRSVNYTRKHFAMRIAEAFMCSMFAASTSIALFAYWGTSLLWAIPIGTVIGFLGTDMLRGVLVSFIKFIADKKEIPVHIQEQNHNPENAYVKTPAPSSKEDMNNFFDQKDSSIRPNIEKQK